MKVAQTLLVLATALLSAAPAGSAPAAADGEFVVPGDNLVLESIAPIPIGIARATAPYGESRPASLFDWHPQRREILVGTRFAETVQVHAVAHPMGARKQLTFFPDRVSGTRYLPDGQRMLVHKDTGGGEWFQLYRFDPATGSSTLLTDGHSRNEHYLLAHHSTRLVFTSTRRNQKDDDLWITDAAGDAATARPLMNVEGGGWSPVAWSPDNQRLLVLETRSINESDLWLVDAASGERRKLLSGAAADHGGQPVSISDAAFTADGRGAFVLTDEGSDFHRLARIALDAPHPDALTPELGWDIEAMSMSEDGRRIALAVNEDGGSALYMFEVAGSRLRRLKGIPPGVAAGLRFSPSGQEIAFTVSGARAPADVYTYTLATGRVERWTRGETGGLDASRFTEPRLVRWKSFDGLELSAYLYEPDPKRFPGPRPVVLSIHGGPESQFRPGYRGQDNYLIQELGLAVIAPNVRGSNGYGKRFLTLDNGKRRADTYRDIETLLDWIGHQPGLDASRVMVMGGSYGGHMTWAVSAFYNDRIRCAMPVVGMSNLVTFLENTEAYRRDLRRVEYGDERDPAMRSYLEDIAPMNHLEAMKKPVFAVVGRNDPRVPWTESRQIVDRLRTQGTPVWMLIANDEGHGYAKKKNRDFLFDAEVVFASHCLLDEAGGAGSAR